MVKKLEKKLIRSEEEILNLRKALIGKQAQIDNLESHLLYGSKLVVNIHEKRQNIKNELDWHKNEINIMKQRGEILDFEDLKLYENCDRQRRVEYVRAEDLNDDKDHEYNSVIFDGMGTYFNIGKEGLKKIL